VRRGRIAGALLAWALFLRGAGRRRPEDVEPDPSTRVAQRDRGAENLVIAAMLLSSLCGLAVPFLYVLTANTQLLGGAFGAALAFAALGTALAGKRVVPHETAVAERQRLDHPETRAEIDEQLAASGDGVTRRRALGAAGAAAGVGICAAAAVPLFELGPKVGQIIARTPWHRGRYLVSEEDERLRADDVAYGEFLTLFPEGADKEAVGSAVVLVRIPANYIHLPRGRETWAPNGLLAYSKICTHAGCAVNTFRYPLWQPTTPHKPALVCPCHYSTFDVGRGAEVIFGPAGRPLPQLPLAIDSAGYVVAAGRLSGPPGPAWWSVRETKTQ
jgi:ubiquinol-cytochrome c reductase iron-sulfur subunit